MPYRTFKGGVSLAECKELTVDRKIRSIPAPDEVIIPLSQHTGEPNILIVAVGDTVKKGQKIGQADAFISAPVHSSVSGRVKAISNTLNPVYGKGPAVIIENNKKDEFLPLERENDVQDMSKEALITLIREAGLVGLGGAAFPTHVKLKIPEGKHVDTLIINGAECEPYLTCDHRLMAEKTEKILRGICFIAGILGVREVFLAIEDNKLSAIFEMEKAVKRVNKRTPNMKIELVILKTKYPQGGEKQLIKAILKREIPPKKLPMDVGCVVQNVGTCLAVYEAIDERKPLIERCVTFTGSCLVDPGNFTVPIGSTIRHVVNCCGGLQKEPAKVIVGGPMMGITQYSLDGPLVKGMSGVIFLSKEDVEIPKEYPCVRCAKCVDICPVKLIPTDIMRMVKHSRWHYLGKLYPLDCLECGACAYVCPSKIPLVQYIKLAKMKELGKK